MSILAAENDDPMPFLKPQFMLSHSTSPAGLQANACTGTERERREITSVLPARVLSAVEPQT
jgi:hypothetical protein